MINLTWKLFSETGNIEAYLLLKELENKPDTNNIIPIRNETEESAPLETKM